MDKDKTKDKETPKYRCAARNCQAIIPFEPSKSSVSCHNCGSKIILKMSSSSGNEYSAR